MNKYRKASRVKESRQCGRKKRYATVSAADAERARRKDPGGHSYVCSWCGFWHISKMRVLSANGDG